MSELGVSAPPIKSDRLRDIVAAVEDLARPFTIYACGATVAIGVLIPPVTPEKLIIAAGVATGVSYFRSKDKQAAIGKQS